MTEFEDIYNNYFKHVYLFVYSLSKDKNIAEDITSETFMKAIKSIDSFKGTCDIRAWLCQIAKNSYISYLRKNKKLVHIDSVSEKFACKKMCSYFENLGIPSTFIEGEPVYEDM